MPRATRSPRELLVAMTKEAIIIDTDPGQDDAVAILLALAATDRLEISGITSVAGNVGVDLTTANALLGLLRTGSGAKVVNLQHLLALEAPVLGPALLRDVAAGEELDAGHHGLVDDARDQVHVVEDPVDAQADQGELALGLEVDVGGALLERVGEDVVEGLSDGDSSEAHAVPPRRSGLRLAA